MTDLKSNKMFVQLSNMSNEERGILISKNKKELENYFGCDLIFHKYGDQPDSGNEMLPYKNHLSRISELINVVEFVPRQTNTEK